MIRSERRLASPPVTYLIEGECAGRGHQFLVDLRVGQRRIFSYLLQTPVGSFAYLLGYFLSDVPDGHGGGGGSDGGSGDELDRSKLKGLQDTTQKQQLDGILKNIW